MFNIGSQELIIIFFVVLMLFGAKRIPEVSKQVGKGLRDFRRAMQGIEDELRFELDDPKPGARTSAGRPVTRRDALPSGRSSGDSGASTEGSAVPKLEPPEGATVRRGQVDPAPPDGASDAPAPVPAPLPVSPPTDPTPTTPHRPDASGRGASDPSGPGSSGETRA